VNRLIALGALLLAACFNPTFNNPTCGPNGECPSGTTCVQNVCRSEGADIDATIDTPPGDPDAMFDAAIDAPGEGGTDAPTDAAVDAPIDGPPIDAPTDGPLVDAPPPTCPSGRIQSPDNPNRCFFKVSSQNPWSQARTLCVNMGGDLAEIYSLAELTVLQPFYQGEPDGVWFGVTDQAQEGVWRYIATNGPVGYTNWAAGEPNNQPGTNADCVRVEANGDWYDDTCADAKPAICVFTFL
jgi:hypothetical protein